MHNEYALSRDIPIKGTTCNPFNSKINLFPTSLCYFKPNQEWPWNEWYDHVRKWFKSRIIFPQRETWM